MTRQQALRDDDRGLSTAVNHVLAIGITAVLIAGLIAAAAGILSSQRQQAAQEELKTIGNRVANQITEADRIVDEGGQGESVRIVVDQPSKVAGQTYTGFLIDDPCPLKPNAWQPNNASSVDTNYCIVLIHDAVPDDRVEVPVEVDRDVHTNPDVELDLTYRGSGVFVIEMAHSP